MKSPICFSFSLLKLLGCHLPSIQFHCSKRDIVYWYPFITCSIPLPCMGNWNLVSHQDKRRKTILPGFKVKNI